MDSPSIAPEANSHFSATEFRANFPHLANMVHLASCSQGALSDELQKKLGELTASLTDSGAPWGLWVKEIEEARRRFAHFINASPDEIAIVSSASEGAYQVASSFSWSNRTDIVTSALEFPSVGHVLRAQRAQGARVRSIDDRFAALDAATWAAQIDESVQLVSVPLVSYHDGAMAPVAEITKLAHNAGALVLVDAYQGAGVVPIDVQSMDCDYLITGTLKYMLGLAGIAFLYVRKGIHSQRAPELTGWFGRVNPFEFDSNNVDYPPEARRFEGGTPAVPSAYAANAGLKLLSGVDQTAGYQHVVAMTDRLAEGLTAGGVRLSRPADPSRRGPQIAVYDADPEALSTWLHDRRIMTAARGELVRLSVHYYTTEQDIDTAVAAVLEYHGRK